MYQTGSPVYASDSTLVVLLVHWVVSAAAILLTAKIVRGFHVRSFVAALIAAVVIGVADRLLWPVLIFLTLPVNVLTLGLFTFVVNGMVLKICAAFAPGFKIDGWFAAIFGSIILTLANTLLHYIIV